MEDEGTVQILALVKISAVLENAWFHGDRKVSSFLLPWFGVGHMRGEIILVRKT